MPFQSAETYIFLTEQKSLMVMQTECSIPADLPTSWPARISPRWWLYLYMYFFPISYIVFVYASDNICPRDGIGIGILKTNQKCP